MKHSNEKMRRAIDSFAKLFDQNAELAIRTSNTPNKNRFVLGICLNGNFLPIAPCIEGNHRYDDNAKILLMLQHVLEEKYPDMMLRDFYVSTIDGLISNLHLDETKTLETVIKGIYHTSRQYSKFIARNYYCDESQYAANLGAVCRSMDEFLVLLDLNMKG